MALTEKQIQELNATYSRPGGQTATDLKNIEYAKTQGYTAPSVQAPTDTTAPPVTPTTPPATSTPSSIYDIYGIDKTKQPTTDVYGAYGLTEPKYTKPVTTEYDTQINKFAPTGDTTEIKKMLDESLANIQAKYDLQREDSKKTTESEFQSRLSGLYNVGVVNPLSSGTGSIKESSNDLLNKRMTAINQAEGAEKSQAIAQAYGLEQDARNDALTFAQNQKALIEKEAQDKYDYERQGMLDKIDMVNNVVNAWKAGQTTERQNKLDAQSNVMDIISTFGSSAFEGMDETKINEIEKATGYPENSLVKGLTSLRKQELLAGKEMNLKTINGSLYNITQDENGVIKAELVIGKKASGGSGSGSGGSGKIPSFEDWIQTKQDEGLNVSLLNDNPAISLSKDIKPENYKTLDELKAEYETEYGSGETKVKLTQTQYNTALGNYVKGTGGSEAEFTSLSPSQKTLWYRGGPTKEKASSSSSSMTDEERQSLLNSFFGQ